MAVAGSAAPPEGAATLWDAPAAQAPPTRRVHDDPAGLAQRRRVLGIVALAGLPLLVLTLLALWQGKTLGEQRVAEERLALARAGAMTAASFVEGNLSTVRSLAWVQAVRDPWGVPNAAELFDVILDQNPDWEGWGVADASGWNAVSTGSPPGTLFIGDRPYFREALATNRPVVSPAVINRRTGNPTIVLAVPVLFDRGDRGVLVASLSSRRLSEELRQLHTGGDVRLMVFDSEAKLFVHPNEAVSVTLPVAPDSPAVVAALAGQAGTTIAPDATGREALVAYAPVRNTGWGVLAVQPTAAAYDVVTRQNGVALGLVALAAALALGIAWHLGGRLAAYYREVQAARALAEADARALARVSAESERRRRFFEGVINSAPVAIAVLRAPDFRHVTVNARYQALKPDTPMLGRTIAEVFPQTVGQGALEPFRRVAETGEQWAAVDHPWRLLGPDGRPETRYFTHVIARLEDAGGPATVLSIVLETTDVVVARRRGEREKDEFLSIASHELKTPLTSLSIAAQMIERMLARGALDEARLARHVGTIRDQVARASRLIGDLLDVSRIEAGRLEITPESVDVARLTLAAVERQRDALPDDGPPREIRAVGLDAPLVIAGDEARLEQVLTNLLSNAVKYSPDGGAVDVRLAREDGHVRLDVVDRGIGVPEEERERLFAPFRRTAVAVSAGVEGTGLGLYIARRIVEAHGGTIGVSDTPGGGATFTVRLPLSGPAGAARPIDAAEGAPRADALPGRRDDAA